MQYTFISGLLLNCFRNFCCDCGNTRFPEMRCQLEPNKRPLNEKNTYNHNYQGLYCICDRPFPDSEDDSDDDDEMVQCIVCEDWFHYKVTKIFF